MAVLKQKINRYRLIAGLLSLLLISTSYAGDFAEGMRAYQAQDYRLALEKWLPAAENGHVLAQTLVGSMYAYGEGVERNDRQAAHWFTLAASNGSAQAQYNLGILYEKGWGVEQNNVEARKWFRMAADNGRKDAASRLALLTELHSDTSTGTTSTPRTDPVEQQAGGSLMPHSDFEDKNSLARGNAQQAWLRQQPAHHYTLQLAASVEKNLLEDYISGLQLEDRHAIVESVRDDTQWYALVYGSYASIRDAQQAHGKLPPGLSAWDPWIRPFGDIKTWRILGGLKPQQEMNGH